MPGWEPIKPATLIPHKTDQARYDQIVAEITELPYSYFYQLHSQTIRPRHRIEALDQEPIKVPGRFDQP